MFNRRYISNTFIGYQPLFPSSKTARNQGEIDIKMHIEFNGKEKDYESGFHYYGARYYWSETLTGWLSVDPMMDKYPGLSSYNYCAWNPILFVDPDGNDWYKYTEVKNNKLHTYYHWKEGHDKSINIGGNTYKNIGAFASIRDKGGKYTNYYQNEWISRSTERQTTKQLSHFLFSREGSGTRSILFGRNSHLSAQSKKELMQGRVSSSYQFYNDAFNITCSTVSTTLNTTGTVVTAVGASLVSTVVGAEIGGAMISVGAVMTDVGTGLAAIQCALNGDTKGTIVNTSAILAGRAFGLIKPNPALTEQQTKHLTGLMNTYFDIVPNAEPLRSN